MNRAADFLKNVSGDTTLIFHCDGDGLCCAVLVYSYLKKKGINVKLCTGDIAESTFERADISDNNIIVDLAVDKNPEYLDRFKDKNILIIDHHPIKSDLNELGFIYINPRFENPDKYISASEIVYEIMKLVSDPQEWIMRIGGVSDRSLKGSDKEHLASKIIVGISNVKGSQYLIKLVEFLSECDSIEDFIENKEFLKMYEDVQKEIDRLVKEFGEPKDEINFFEVKSKYKLKAVISTILFDKYPDKTFIVYLRSNDMYQISGRSIKYDLGKLFDKASHGIGKGGGHSRASGAIVTDIEKFKKRFLELI